MELLGNLDIYIRFIAAFAIVMGLIAVAVWAAKYLGFATTLRNRGANQRRLFVSESIAIDTKRRLLLVNLDDREHLICVGGPNDFTVKNDISPAIRFNEDKIVELEAKLSEVKND